MLVQIHLKTSVVIDGKQISMMEGEASRIDNIDTMINVEGHLKMDTDLGRMFIPLSNIAMIFIPADQRRAKRDQIGT